MDFGEDVCPRCDSTQVTNCWAVSCQDLLEPDDDECPNYGAEQKDDD